MDGETIRSGCVNLPRQELDASCTLNLHQRPACSPPIFAKKFGILNQQNAKFFCPPPSPLFFSNLSRLRIGHQEVVKLLLANGAKVNQATNDGVTRGRGKRQFS